MKAVKVERSEAVGIEPVMWRVTCLRSIFKVIKGEKLARQPNSVTALTSKVDEESFLEVLDIHAVEGAGVYVTGILWSANNRKIRTTRMDWRHFSRCFAVREIASQLSLPPAPGIIQMRAALAAALAKLEVMEARLASLESSLGVSTPGDAALAANLLASRVPRSRGSL